MPRSRAGLPDPVCPAHCAEQHPPTRCLNHLPPWSWQPRTSPSIAQGPRGPRLESPDPGHDQTRGRLRKDGAEGHGRGGCLSRTWAPDNRNGYTRWWTRAVKRACKSPSLRQAPRSQGPGPTEPEPWTSESAGPPMSMAMWK